MSDNTTTLSALVSHCAACGYNAKNARGLAIHCGKEHPVVALTPTSDYVCPWCSESKAEGRALSQHAKKIHGRTGEELYTARFLAVLRTTCVDCGTNVRFIDQDKGYSERCSACTRKHTYASLQHTSWNKGLTKATDERVATSADHMQQHYAEHGHHNTGRTKNNDAGVAAKARKISIAKKGKPHTELQKAAHKGAHSIGQAAASIRFNHFGFNLIGEYSAAMTPTEVRCIKCNNTCVKKLHVIEHGGKCPTCFPPWANKISQWQHEIADYVSSLVENVEINNRSTIAPLELDIFVPDRSFAIECNGLYWHSDAAGQFEPDHAENKRLYAVQKGIRLLTLFEDEWRNKREIVESMICHRLGLSKMFGARKTTIVRLSPKDVKQFIDKNHLDGNVRSQFAIAMTLPSGELVGACTLRWARNGNDKETLEVARLCFSKGIHVQGGVSRLLHTAQVIGREHGAKRLLSYSDNRLGGGSYATAGMEHDGLTAKRFWWTDFVRRYDRFNFRADSKRGLTEKEVAKEEGVTRIYSCTNSRWIIDL